MMTEDSNRPGYPMLGFKIITAALLWTLVLPWPNLALGANGMPLHFYHRYEMVLGSSLDGQGRIRYSNLKIQCPLLDQVLVQFGTLSPAAFSRWKPRDQEAFYINAYNARALRVEAGKQDPSLALYFPQDGSALSFSLLRQPTTLDQVERDAEERSQGDPRVYLALATDFQEGPSFRNRPYYGAQLESLLEEQAWRFFKRPDQLNIDRARNVVTLSPYLKRYAGDFVKGYGTRQFAFLDVKDRAVLNFVSQHVKPKDRDYLVQAPVFSLRYADENPALTPQP